MNSKGGDGLNDEVGSIMNFFYRVFPVQIYDREIPIQIKTPSLYFPPPSVVDGNDTVSTYMKTYSLNVKLFHKDSQQAHDEAEKIAEAVRERRSTIPLVDTEGTETGESLRINRIESRISDKGVAVLVVQWNSRYWYKRDEKPSLQDFDFTSGVK